MAKSPSNRNSHLALGVLFSGIFLLWIGICESKSTQQPTDLKKLTVEQLISLLANEKCLGNHGDDFPSGSRLLHFFDTWGEFNPPDSTPCPSPPVFAELVKRGTRSIPGLLAHLDDDRLTKCIEKFSNNPDEGEILFGSEYESRFTDQDRQPVGTVKPVWGAQYLAKEPPVEMCYSMPGRRTYTLRVGDLCFIALGKIVHRDYRIFRTYLRTFITPFTTINSPVYSPALVRACREEWSGLTEESHREILVQDCYQRAPYLAASALFPLQEYYPETAREIFTRLVKRKPFDEDIVDTLLNEIQITKTSPSEINRLPSIFHLARFLQTLIKIKIDDEFLDKILILFHLIFNQSEFDIKQCQWKLENFKNQHGPDIIDKIPSIIFENQSLMDPDNRAKVTLAQQLKAQLFLKEFFPASKPDHHEFVNAASYSEMSFFLKYAPRITGDKVDSALFELFKTVAGASPEENDQIGIALSCADRLVGTGFEPFVKNWVNREIEKTNGFTPQDVPFERIQELSRLKNRLMVNP